MGTTRIVLMGMYDGYSGKVVKPWVDEKWKSGVQVENNGYHAILVVNTKLFSKVYRQLVENEPRDLHDITVSFNAPHHAGEVRMGKAFVKDEATLMDPTKVSLWPLLSAQPSTLARHREKIDRDKEQ